MNRSLLQFLSFFLSLLFLAGCTLSPSAGVAPSVTPTQAAPTGTVAAAATATPTSLPGQVVRIQNEATGLYLYADSGQAALDNLPASDLRSQWSVQDYQGSQRIQNLATGKYLAIEHLQPYVEVISIQSDWMSPRWGFETDPSTQTVVIRNVWHNWQILYVKDGTLGYDRVDAQDPSARWTLISIGGETLSTATPAAAFTLPAPAEPENVQGAVVPWDEYEAEAGQTNGTILQPDRTFGTFAAESSGRSAVQLAGLGQYVQFTSLNQANSIVVRYIIPDSEDGKGLDATLSLYVNGEFRQKLSLTSRYSWSYGGEEYTLNTPAAGGAHHFYDETRALVGDIPAGATVKLQIDAEDTAEYYVVDLIDLEQVAAPKAMPAGFLSITDFGAVPNDGKDDGAAIRRCILQAQAQHTGVWIPEGVFESVGSPFEVSNVAIQGAGMWYSTLHGKYARFNCTGDNCRFADFAILGETIARDDKSPENGFNGGAGSGSRLENIWVEHTKVGYWVGPGTTNGLVIINSRFRDLYADGVNFCNGTSNSLVENSHFRNTGDDAIASWSPQGSPVNTGNVFRFNTIQVPWRANCLAIYGGEDNRIENNYCADVVTYPGILIAQQFNSNPFGGQTIVANNTLVRAGGPMFNEKHGALKIWADQGDITGLQITNLTIQDSTFSGIEIQGSHAVHDLTLDGVRVLDSGAEGIFLHSDLSGEASLAHVVVSGSAKSAVLNNAPKNKFQLTLGDGNEGW